MFSLTMDVVLLIMIRCLLLLPSNSALAGNRSDYTGKSRQSAVPSVSGSCIVCKADERADGWTGGPWPNTFTG